MNKKHYAFFLKKNKKNPIAKALKFFTPKVIRDKTKYRRKDKHVQKRSFWEST
jgi:pyocin large subunit-like protein